jgi:hypothetical protein
MVLKGQTLLLIVVGNKFRGEINAPHHTYTDTVIMDTSYSLVLHIGDNKQYLVCDDDTRRESLAYR